jgi:stress response protein SCP2
MIWGAIAFLLDSNGKVTNLGRTANVNGRQVDWRWHYIFNSLNHPSGKTTTGDNRTGEGDGDDEQIMWN